MKQFSGKQFQSTEPSVDIILKVLNAAQAARPDAPFISSLLQQYRERGGLSKKQLEGLHDKARKIEGFSLGLLATLEAIILKRPDRNKKEITVLPAEKKEDTDAPLITAILEKYPGHKRVLYFKMKKDNREDLNLLEKNELNKFVKLLLK